VIHSGAVIGADGFGFVPQCDGVYEKMPQVGNVILEDAVEIGANTTVDRATIGHTIIRTGTKLDNLVQVGHNAEIGKHNVVVSQAGIAGSTKHRRLQPDRRAGGHRRPPHHRRPRAHRGPERHRQQPPRWRHGAGLAGLQESASHDRSFVVFRNLPELQKRIDAGKGTRRVARTPGTQLRK
jgi:UDP-3-O-[3-hydroxymyristoyl] glucosamine N-acyltransferase